MTFSCSPLSGLVGLPKAFLSNHGTYSNFKLVTDPRNVHRQIPDIISPQEQ
jgi:hypothetical protein